MGGSSRAQSFVHELEARSGNPLQDAWLFEGGTWRQIAGPADPQDDPILVPFGPPFAEDVLLVSRYPARWVARDEDFVLPGLDAVGPRSHVGSWRGAPLVLGPRATLLWNKDARRWDTLSGLKKPRFAGALVETNEGTLLVGGRIPGGDVQATVDLFDGRTWREVGALAGPRAFHAVVTAGGRTRIVGGFGSGSEDLFVEELDLATGRTTVTDAILPPMTAFRAVASGDRICVIGGLRYSAGRDHPSLPLGIRWI